MIPLFFIHTLYLVDFHLTFYLYFIAASSSKKKLFSILWYLYICCLVKYLYIRRKINKKRFHRILYSFFYSKNNTTNIKFHIFIVEYNFSDSFFLTITLFLDVVSLLDLRHYALYYIFILFFIYFCCCLVVLYSVFYIYLKLHKKQPYILQPVFFS